MVFQNRADHPIDLALELRHGFGAIGGFANARRNAAFAAQRPREEENFWQRRADIGRAAMRTAFGAGDRLGDMLAEAGIGEVLDEGGGAAGAVLDSGIEQHQRHMPGVGLHGAGVVAGEFEDLADNGLVVLQNLPANRGIRPQLFDK